MIGTTLGPYRIESQAGRGGMGVVYRAMDTRLQRTAAIKVLRADAVADPDRKARFVREAQAASALNHPNIVTIYQIGTEGLTDYIAMEFVVGRSLDQVMDGRPLPIDEALRYAIAVAGALAAAHEIGLVHRDLKPANVMVTEKGDIKLLDFGLAKLAERTLGSDSSPTVTSSPETSTGMVIGTVAYMSPEQARGQKVDARSDIFSFGVVLHEMLTGSRPPNDSSVGVLLGAPRDLRRIVSRCLQPDPSRRFQMIDDVRMALEDADLAPEASRAPAESRRRRLAVWVVPAVLAAAGVIAFVFWPRSAANARGPVLTRLTMDSGLTTDQALSADGKFIAYASDRSGDGNLDIWVRQVAGGEPARLTSDAADDYDPSFSPDGARIAFRSERNGGGIYVVSTLGGDARRVFDQGRRPRWSPDGTRIACWAGVDLAFLMDKADAPRIYVLPAAGGEPRRLFSDFAVAWAPIWSADSKSLLFPGSREPAGRTDWWVAPLDGGSPSATGADARIRTAGLSPSPESVFLPEAWASDGQVLFSASLGDSTNLWQIHVPERGPSDGPAQRLTTGTGLEIHPSAAPGGTLVFSAVTRNIDLWSLPTDTPRGVVTGPMQRLTQDPATDAYPWLSPDGKTLVFISNRSRAYDLWRRDMASGKDELMAADVTFPHLPIITKDGSRVIFSRGGKGKRWSTLALSAIARERSSTPQTICEDCNPLWDVSGDGKWSLSAPGVDDEIDAREIATGRTIPFMKAPGEIMGRLRISADDRWLAFAHRSSGVIRVVVVPFRPGALLGREAWIPLTAGDAIAIMPTWSPDGGLIYYLTDRDGSFCIWAQRIDRASGRPSGNAFAVWHFHEAHQSMAGIPLPLRGLAIAGDRIVTTLVESTGNIWMSANSGR